MDFRYSQGVDVVEIIDVKQHIREKKLLPFYCFTGEETGIMNIYIKKMAEVINANLVSADRVSEIVYSTTNTALFQNCKIFVIHDDPDFLKHEEVWEDYVSGKVLKNNVLILVLNSLDKRSKFYKTYNSSIVEFKHLNSSILSVYASREIDLSDDNMSLLIDLCENDYSRLFLEIDKIKQYCSQNNANMSQNEAFLTLLKEGAIYCPPRDAIFDFADAVLRHQVNRAYNLLNESYAIGEHKLALLSVLYSNTKQVLQVQSCPKGSNISKTTGLTDWQIRCAKDRMGFYRTGDLVYIMRIIQDTEKKIKQGIIEEDYAVDYVLANIL